MEMTMNMGAFEELNNSEMLIVDGGFSWREFGASMIAGGVVGGVSGVAAGGAGAVPGAVGGALAGGLTYCIVSLISG